MMGATTKERKVHAPKVLYKRTLQGPNFFFLGLHNYKVQLFPTAPKAPTTALEDAYGQITQFLWREIFRLLMFWRIRALDCFNP